MRGGVRVSVTAAEVVPEGGTATTSSSLGDGWSASGLTMVSGTHAESIASGRARVVWSRRYARWLSLSDAVVIIAAIALVRAARTGIPALSEMHLSGLAQIAAAAVFALAWTLALGLTRSRNPQVLGSGAAEFRKVLTASAICLATLVVGGFVLGVELPRGLLLTTTAVGTAGLLISRMVARRWLAQQRAQGTYRTRVLALGSPESVAALGRAAVRDPHRGIQLVGACVPDATGLSEVRLEENDSQHPSHPMQPVPVLGDVDRALALSRLLDVDEIAVCSTSGLDEQAVRALRWALDGSRVRVVVVPAISDLTSSRMHAERLGDLNLLHLDPPAYRSANRLGKRIFDAIGSAVLLVLFSPLMVAIALSVKLTSPGPVFFRQERVGIDSSRFRMVKFRSMVADAESRLDEVRHLQDKGNVVMFKSKNDSRVTPVGRVLRKLSLDELPQLLNVLRGEMSLVGPRPPLPAEVEKFESDDMRKFLVKPGMTGLWQVSGRSELSFTETSRLDQSYAENWSMGSDLGILARTFGAVAKGM